MAHLSRCKGGSWKIRCFAHVLLSELAILELGIFLVEGISSDVSFLILCGTEDFTESWKLGLIAYM